MTEVSILLTSDATAVHAEIAGSRLSVLTATGHVPILSAPDQVVAEMRAYLS